MLVNIPLLQQLVTVLESEWSVDSEWLWFIWSFDLDAVPMEVAPLKFCIPHVAVSFGPSGQLVWVSPALASEGEPAQVELHSLEVTETWYKREFESII